MNELNRYIIRILASNTTLDTYALHHKVQTYKKTTLANTYRALQQLQHKMIVQKNNGILALNSSWVLDFLQLGESMKQNYIDNTPEITQLRQGEILTIKKSSFFEIDIIWSDMIGKLMGVHDQKETVYFFNAHNYHLLGTPETEISFVKRLVDSGHTLKILIGDTSVLDQYCVDLLKTLGAKAVMSDSHSFKQKGYYINIIGDYIIELIMPQSVNQYLEMIFKETKLLEEFNPAIVKQSLSIKESFRLLIRKDAKQATRLKGEIDSYFPQKMNE